MLASSIAELAKLTKQGGQQAPGAPMQPGIVNGAAMQPPAGVMPQPAMVQ
jgi:hypothetical protein